MKHLNNIKYFKNFESISHTDIKVSEANKIKSLPGFDFIRTYSDIYGYFLYGKRTELPMESISIRKEGEVFKLHIRRSPGYFKNLVSAGSPNWEEDWSKDKEWNLYEELDDLESLIKFLSEFRWYDMVC